MNTEESKPYPEQSNRLDNVIKDLKLKQVDIVKVLECNNISIDEQRMCKYVWGKRRITDDVLNGLHMYYFINPDYIKGKSDEMYNIPKTILNYAFLFAQEIAVIENPHRIKLHKDSTPVSAERYLHITMDEKYYNYLIHLDLLEEASEKGDFDKEKVISGIKELYKNGEHRQMEYVLLPRNTFLNILRNDPSKREVFQELIDTEEYHNYPNCKKIYQTK